MKKPEEFLCPTHGYYHKKGSKVYEACLEDYMETVEVKDLGVSVEDAAVMDDSTGMPSAPEERTIEIEAPEVEVSEPEPEPEPIEISSTEVYVTSFANSDKDKLLCRLVSTSPDNVTVKSSIYISGERTFRKDNQPFTVTLQEYTKVLMRGGEWFELV